jgi:hypothetical protein
MQKPAICLDVNRTLVTGYNYVMHENFAAKKLGVAEIIYPDTYNNRQQFADAYTASLLKDPRLAVAGPRIAEVLAKAKVYYDIVAWTREYHCTVASILETFKLDKYISTVMSSLGIARKADGGGRWLSTNFKKRITKAELLMQMEQPIYLVAGDDPDDLEAVFRAVEGGKPVEKFLAISKPEDELKFQEVCDRHYIPAGSPLDFELHFISSIEELEQFL